MAQLFQCDKCGEQTTEPLKVWIAFDRTPEEIKQLMINQDAPLGVEEQVKQTSRVRRELEFCRKCYDEFKKEYYAEINR